MVTRFTGFEVKLDAALLLAKGDSAEGAAAHTHKTKSMKRIHIDGFVVSGTPSFKETYLLLMRAPRSDHLPVHKETNGKLQGHEVLIPEAPIHIPGSKCLQQSPNVAAAGDRCIHKVRRNPTLEENDVRLAKSKQNERNTSTH